MLWDAPIVPKQDSSGWAQMGCFYGSEGGNAAIRPVILIHESLQGRLSPDVVSRLVPASRDAEKLIWLENVAPHVGSAEVWDDMRKNLVTALTMIE